MWMGKLENVKGGAGGGGEVMDKTVRGRIYRLVRSKEGRQ